MSSAPAAHVVPDVVSRTLARYGCGSVQFAGTENTFYERHLLFDKAIDPRAATLRDQFEAFARSVRDVLARRWALTTETYARENPKLVYYVSLEFLIGRSLANNVTNLSLETVVEHAIAQKHLDWIGSARTGARPRSRQWWPRASRSLLPGLDGHPATAGDGLWPALRVRDLQAVDP